MHLQRTLKPYARKMTWDIQTVASRFVERRNHSQEQTLIVPLLRFRHVGRDYIPGSRGGNRGTRWLAAVRVRTGRDKYQYCQGRTPYEDEMLTRQVAILSRRTGGIRPT